jgi:hypothetical protein
MSSSCGLRVSKVFDSLSASVPPGRLILTGVVLATLHLTYVLGRALVERAQSKRHVAEIEALGRAQVITIQEVGKVLIALAEVHRGSVQQVPRPASDRCDTDSARTESDGVCACDSLFHAPTAGIATP